MYVKGVKLLALEYITFLEGTTDHIFWHTAHSLIIHCSESLDLTILTAHTFIIHCFDQLGLPILTKTTFFLICLVWSQSLRHSISRFLNRVFSQLDLFSIGSFLNRIFSQSDLFSIGSFWGRHHQLDDSLVGQLTTIVYIQITNIHVYLQTYTRHTYTHIHTYHIRE